MLFLQKLKKMPSSAAVKYARTFSNQTAQLGISHSKFLEDVAKVKVPAKLQTMLSLLEMQGYNLLSPTQRKTLNPLLIPIAQKKDQDGMLCFLRWPTQKEDMDLQIVTTTAIGVQLHALSTDKYVHRQLAELDFYKAEYVEDAAQLVNKSGEVYKLGDSSSLFKPGKFPSKTSHDLRLLLDRYLIMKVGPFPDCYERLANDFLDRGNDLSALVTCEKSISSFFGWGHPINFHANLLMRMGREREAKDTARSSMQSPKWTLASSKQDMETIISMAGFSNAQIVGEMHKYRSTDPRQKDVDEGLTKEQVALDQAAHLMDAVTLGSIEGGWESARREIADRYRLGGYPHIATFVEAV